MDSEQYALAVGETLLGLHSLEFALRRYLHALDATDASSAEVPPISEGETLSSDILTNRDALGALIEKFNRSLVTAQQSELSLDVTLADVSAVLTTGRIWGTNAEPPLTIVQFSTPSNGLVRCTSDLLMDHAWLETQQKRLSAARANVEEAGRRVQPEWWIPAASLAQPQTAA